MQITATEESQKLPALSRRFSDVLTHVKFIGLPSSESIKPQLSGLPQGSGWTLYSKDCQPLAFSPQYKQPQIQSTVVPHTLDRR